MKNPEGHVQPRAQIARPRGSGAVLPGHVVELLETKPVASLEGRGHSLTATVDSDCRRRQLLHFHGCGAAFPWMIGYARFVREQRGLSARTHYSGVSSGALIALLLALDIDLDDAVTLAIDLQNEVSGRRLGLFGIWRSLLLKYYDHLIPEAAEVARLANLHIGLTELNRGTVYVSSFRDKRDLVGALLASQHVPFFMDLRPSARYRGQRYLDAWWRQAPPPAGFAHCHEVAFSPLTPACHVRARPWERWTRKTKARARALQIDGYHAAHRALWNCTSGEGGDPWIGR